MAPSYRTSNIFSAEEEQKATDEGMPEYEADTERVVGATDAGGGYMVEDSETAEERNAEATEPETTETVEQPDTISFKYVGKKKEVRTRYGTFRPDRVYTLPANKAKTVLEMKQPDRSPAFEEA